MDPDNTVQIALKPRVRSALKRQDVSLWLFCVRRLNRGYRYEAPLKAVSRHGVDVVALRSRWCFGSDHQGKGVGKWVFGKSTGYC